MNLNIHLTDNCSITNYQSPVMKSLTDYPIEELKLIYNILHNQFPTHTELMNSELLQDLQHYLLTKAEASGVEVSQHSGWANWLITDKATPK